MLVENMPAWCDRHIVFWRRLHSLVTHSTVDVHFWRIKSGRISSELQTMFNKTLKILIFTCVIRMIRVTLMKWRWTQEGIHNSPAYAPAALQVEFTRANWIDIEDLVSKDGYL